MVGWGNADKDEPSASSAENQIPIYKPPQMAPRAARNRIPLYQERAGQGYLDDLGRWAVGQPRGRGFPVHPEGNGESVTVDGAQRGLDFHEAIGPDRVYARIKSLGDYPRDGLKKIEGVEIYTSLHPATCAGITSYSIIGLEPGKLTDELWRRKKIRTRGVPQCTHIYNSPGEIDTTLEVVRDMARSAKP
jgi:hypothetical protein